VDHFGEVGKMVDLSPASRTTFHLEFKEHKSTGNEKDQLRKKRTIHKFVLIGVHSWFF